MTCFSGDIDASVEPWGRPVHVFGSGLGSFMIGSGAVCIAPSMYTNIGVYGQARGTEPPKPAPPAKAAPQPQKSWLTRWLFGG